MKYFIYLFLLTITLSFAEDLKQEEDSFFQSVSDEFVDMTNKILDANISDALKLENLQNYVNNIKFDDNFTKEELNYNLIAHRKNFIIAGYDTRNHDDVDAAGDTYKRDKQEVQFQISIKMPLYKDFLGTGGILYGAYTQNSYWQVFDKEHSAPFRETNYMPEAFIDWDMNKKLGSVYLKKIRLTFTHQSNGQDLPRSRSWNRNDFMIVMKRNDFYFGTTFWNRWDEKEKKDSNSVDGDDNPNLEKYIGKQKYFIKYKNDDYSVELSHQNDIFKYNSKYGNTILDISFPSFNKNFDFVLRYFNGYGESLIDYNEKVNRVSFGILLTDWI